MSILKRGAECIKKNREKDKIATKKYGQAILRHSQKGVYSCIFAALSFAILMSCIVFAYVKRGETTGLLGGVVFLTVFLPIYGIRAGIRGLKEREKRYQTCKIGIVSNGVILLGLIFIFWGGLM